MPFKAEGISKRSSAGWLLRDVSFECENGEVLGVLSTDRDSTEALLSAIARLDKPSSGTVQFASKPNANDDPPKIHHIGLRTGSRRTLPGRLFDGESSTDGSDALSLITEAATAGPDIVVIGPSFFGCVHAPKDEMAEALRRLKDGSYRCVVVGLSDFEDAFLYCDRVVLLHNGEVVQLGKPEDVYLQPSSLAAARITGRHNLFEARRISSSKEINPEYQTIQGGHRLTVSKMDKAKLGPMHSNVFLGIRPEHISISFGASFPEDNLLKAVVNSVRFLGPSTLVMLDAGGLEISAFVLRLVGLDPGEECMIGLPPDRIAVFKD